MRIAAAVLAAGLLIARAASARFPIDDQWTLVSRGGWLNCTLVDAVEKVDIGPYKNVLARVWNGSFVAPLLKVKPGDTIVITFINRLSEPTNLHFHGMVVSPQYGHDNVLTSIVPGQTFTITIAIPSSHPSGLFWYHAHEHMYTDEQIMNGMKGMLNVAGLLDPFPGLRKIKQVFLGLNDFYFDSVMLQSGTLALPLTLSHMASANPTHRIVSGMFNATIPIHPGETQLFSFIAMGPDISYLLALGDHNSTFFVIARDGMRQNQLTASNTFLLDPGSRLEVLWTAPRHAEKIELLTLGMNTGIPGQSNYYPRTVLAYIDVAGPRERKHTRLPLPREFPRLEDLRMTNITQERRFMFQLLRGNFTINGQIFNASRVDVTVPLGSVERWVISNADPFAHTFHIHQGSFQVVEVNGVQQPFYGYIDNADIPARNATHNSTVAVIIPFRNAIIVGDYVFHCHILNHEDKGMMMRVRVVSAAGG